MKSPQQESEARWTELALVEIWNVAHYKRIKTLIDCNILNKEIEEVAIYIGV